MTLDWDAAPGRPIPSGCSSPTCPYNVATPLVCDLLDDVPAIRRMLVMVQREVAERLAAPAGSAAYGAVSVKVAYWATARHRSATCRRRCSCPGRRSSRHSSRSSGTSPPARRTRRPLPARAHGVRSAPQDAAPVPGRPRHRRPVRRRRRRRDGPTRRARPRRLGPSDRGGRRVTPDAVAARVVAPAKLTLSLRITGVRPDGYHLLDAEMVTLDLADTLTLDAAVPTASPSAGPTPPACRPTAPTWSPGRWPPWVAPPPCTSTSRSPTAAGSAAARPMRQPCCAGPVIDDLDAAARLGADVPFCLVGGRASCRGIGEIVEPLPVEPLTVTLVVPPLHVSTPAVYRAWDALGGPTGRRRQRPGAGGPHRRARAG